MLPGTTGDKGDKQPTGYIAYTPSKDGTLSFTFSSSAVNGKNKPRIYYCEDDFSVATKNSADMLAEASDADTDTFAELEVKAGTTYYIFGYLYNYTSAFSYTFSDFKFTDKDVIPLSELGSETITPIGKYADKVTIKKQTTGSGTSIVITPVGDIGTVTLYTAVYSGTALSRITYTTYTTADGKIKIPYSAPELNSGESCKMMLWDSEMSPLTDAI